MKSVSRLLKLEHEELKTYRRYIEVLQTAQLLIAEAGQIAHSIEVHQVIGADQRARCSEIAERLRHLRSELLGLVTP